MTCDEVRLRGSATCAMTPPASSRPRAWIHDSVGLRCGRGVKLSPCTLVPRQYLLDMRGANLASACRDRLMLVASRRPEPPTYLHTVYNMAGSDTAAVLCASY